jgi:hypothetical protein
MANTIWKKGKSNCEKDMENTEESKLNSEKDMENMEERQVE